MALLATAIVMLSLGAVSAFEDTSFNQTALTDCNSQDLSLSEVNTDINENNLNGVSTVSVGDVNQNDELLKATDEDVLSDVTTLEIINAKDSYTKSDSITIKTGSMSMISDSDEVNVYLNDKLESTTTYKDIHSSSGYALSLSNAKIGENTIYCSANSLFGSYTSDSVTFTVNDGSGSGTGGESGQTNDIVLSFEQGSSTEGSKFLYPFTDTQAWISVQGGNYGDATYMNLAVDFGDVSPSSPVIQYKKTTESSWSDIPFTGTNPVLKFHNANHNSDVITWAGGYTYDIRVSNGDKTSNVLTVTCISGSSYIHDFEFDPNEGVEGETIDFKFKPIYNSGTITQGYISFFSSENRNAASRLGTMYATSSSQFDNGFITGQITLPEVDADTEYTVYYVFVGKSTNGGHNDIDDFKISIKNSGSEQPVAKTLKMDIATVDYPNEVQAIVTASQTGTYTITVGSKTVPVEITESDLVSGKTVSLGQFDAGNDYTATIVSDNDASLTNSTPFAVNKGTITLEVASEGNNTSNGVKTLTTTAGDATTGVVKYFEGETQIGEDSALKTVFDISSLGAGSHTITVKYFDNNYQAEDKTVVFNIKGGLTITLTRNGEGLVKPGDTVYFTISYSQPVTENIELWINDYKLDAEDGSDSTQVTFDASDVGKNDVFIKFLGNNMYEPCESNNVTINVVEPVATTVTLELNTTDVLVNGKILITPKVVDGEGNPVTVGTVTICNDLLGNDIARINVGESYSYTLDSNNFNPYNNPYFLYAKYSGATGDEAIYEASQTSSGTKYNQVYSNSITLTVNGESEVTVLQGASVNFLASVANGQGTIVIVDKDGVETEISGETPIKFENVGEFIYYAKFTRSDSSYYASVNSTPVTVYVNEIVAPVIEIELDKTSVSKDGTITVTPTVTGGSDEKGIVNFYDENNVKIGSINLALQKSFEYTVTGEAGSSHSIIAEYVDVNTLYPSVNSTKKDYTIKGQLTITLTRNGDGLVKPGDTVYFTISYSQPVTENIELWINDYKLDGEDGSDSTQVTFDASDVGKNDVFIKFLGNDNYEPCVSNNVTVNVIKPLTTTVSLELSSDEVIPGKNITLIPKVLDENNNEVTVGLVKIYDNMFANNDPIATVNAGETVNFTDLLNYAGTTHYLYAKYMGADGSDVSYEASTVSSGASYTVYSDNSVQLTANDLGEVTIYKGQSVNIKAVTNGNGVITLFVDGAENTTLVKGEASSITLNEVKDYEFIAKYVKGSDHYVSAESDKVIVHVVETPVVNEITVKVDSVTLPDKVEIVVTAIVDGNYTIDVKGMEVVVNVTGGEGKKSVELPAGEYYANVTGNEGAIITNAVFTVSPEPVLGKLVIRDANYPENATLTLCGEGNVTIYLEYYLIRPTENPTTERITFDVGGNTKIVSELVNGSYTGAFSVVINQSGEFTINASYYAWKLMEGEVSFDSDNVLSYSVTITEPSKKDITLDVLVDGDKEDDNCYDGEWNDSFDIQTTASDDIEGTVIYKEGEIELGRAAVGEVFEINASTLGLGQHNITAFLVGTSDYNESSYEFTITVGKKIIWYTLQIDNVTYPYHAVGKFFSEVNGNYTITINGTPYVVEFVWTDVNVPVSFDIIQLPKGTYTPSGIVFEDMEHYEFGVSEIEGQNTLPTFEVKSDESILNDKTLSVSNGTSPIFSIDLPGAIGNLTVIVGNKSYTKELKDGKATIEITDLPAGNYTAKVTYSGDENHNKTTADASFKVYEKQTADANKTLDATVPEGSTDPTFSIDLPGATGNLTVSVNGKNYTKELVNGKASITINDLNPGNYNVTISYSGDRNYSPISKSTVINVPKPKLSAKNINVVYSSKATYKVRVMVDGKAVSGKYVSIKFNGKTYKVKTDKKGFATLKLKTNIKVKKYTITAEFKGIKISNKVTVKHLIIAKNLKIKKSKKVVKIKVKTSKVNGKFLKGKKLKLKIKGKTLKAKINKKGVATFKVKKNILKKLKAGKKYTYKVTYGKDTVAKKVKVKR